MGIFDIFKKSAVNLSKPSSSDPVNALMKLTAQKMLEAKMFWDAFEKEKEHFLKIAPQEAVRQTNALLQKHFPGVYAEYQQTQEGQYNKMVLSANGVLKYFNGVHMLLKNAPALTGIEVCAFRQRAEQAEFGISMQDFSLQSSEVLLKATPRQGRIALEMTWSKSIESGMLEHAKHMSLIIMDHVLGEYDVVVKVCSLDFRDNALSEFEKERWVPLNAFLEVFDHMWKDTLGHTQLFPSGKESWHSFEVNNKGDEEDTLIGALNASAQSVACRADMGVRLDVHVHVNEKQALDRIYEYEDALNAKLKPSQLGLHVLSLFPLAQHIRTMTWYVFDELSTLQTAVDVAKLFPDLEMTFSSEYDPCWNSYLTWVQD